VICSYIGLDVIFKNCFLFKFELYTLLILGMRRYGHHTIRYVSIQRETIWLFSIRYDTIRIIIEKIQTFTMFTYIQTLTMFTSFYL